MSNNNYFQLENKEPDLLREGEVSQRFGLDAWALILAGGGALAWITKNPDVFYMSCVAGMVVLDLGSLPVPDTQRIIPGKGVDMNNYQLEEVIEPDISLHGFIR